MFNGLAKKAWLNLKSSKKFIDDDSSTSIIIVDLKLTGKLSANKI